MDILDEVKKSLDDNSELIDSVKENIFELVYIFHNKFKDVDLTNLINRLRTLKIERSSKFINKNVSKYDFRNNIIYFNTEEMNKGYDMRHVFMFELLNIITSTDTQTGFNNDNKLLALNTGYTEIFANFLVGNDSDVPLYPCEATMTNIISTIIGDEYLMKAYFNNDSNILLNRLVEMGVEL